MVGQTTSRNDEGFSAAEVLITIFVAAIFLQAIFTLFTVINQSIERARVAAAADDFAYSELRKYARGTFVCSTDDDLVANPNAAGRQMPNYPITDGFNLYNLPKPASLNLTTNAVDGCKGGLSLLTKLTVTVQYGPNNTKVEHATYVRE